ncbi:MAG TPA: hypothetical protein VMH33_07450 [Solirubrobacterales bacterium]|nr:hypothetical protein [Solirubrobacterales bacterium]
MKSAIDLLDLPYSYWQLPLYTEAQFRREAKARGLHLTENQLEGLHRLRVLTPILRVKRDGRAIAAAARRKDPFIWEKAHWEPTSRADLVEARSADRLHDPTDEQFKARRRLQRQVGEITYRSSEYLYSHHQLLALPAAKTAVRHVRYSNKGAIVGFDDLHPAESGRWPAHARWLHPRIIAISALEPIYYPRVIRRLRYGLDELEAYEEWRRELPPRAMLDWLGTDPDWVRESARTLLYEADQLDPLGRWLEVVREADPARWELLKGEARSVIDLRIGAEILLSYYDRLVRSGLATEIEPPPPRVRDEFGGRLRPNGGLDSTLTDFGLSPHPRLILMVEGETELHIFPRLMEMFGMRLDRDYIAIESAQGVNKNIAALIAYAVAPRTERAEHGRYLRLEKPLTRLLAVMDAEGKVATAQGRKRRWKAWVKRIVDTLPAEDRTAPVRQSIERLVEVETWNAAGESFEFAHFTDEELAVAINEVDDRPNAPSLNRRIEIVAHIRRERGNLDSTLKGRSKVALAGALWPILRAKIEVAEVDGRGLDIPIVRALEQGAKMAHEFPRRNLVIPLKEANQG